MYYSSFHFRFHNPYINICKSGITARGMIGSMIDDSSISLQGALDTGATIKDKTCADSQKKMEPIINHVEKTLDPNDESLPLSLDPKPSSLRATHISNPRRLKPTPPPL